MKKLIDLSHTVEHGMITYKGLPGPLICDFLSREASKAHYIEFFDRSDEIADIVPLHLGMAVFRPDTFR